MNMKKHASEAYQLLLVKEANAYAKAALIGAPVGAALGALAPVSDNAAGKNMSKMQRAGAGAVMGAAGGAAAVGIARNGGVLLV